MTPREQLRQKILEAVTSAVWEIATEADLAEAADAVMRLFPRIEEDVDEIHTTAASDTRHQVMWTKWAVARCPLEGGSYQGAARTSPLGY
jgi:hypothetical protein